MDRRKISLFLSAFIILFSSVAFAQFPIIGAEDVKTWMTGKKHVVLIDARPAEEYREAHIPGAVSIPADQIKTATAKLPKDKTTPLIFYCRGAG